MKDRERDCLARPPRPTRSERASGSMPNDRSQCRCINIRLPAASTRSLFPGQFRLAFQSAPTYPSFCSIVNTREGRTSHHSIPAGGGRGLKIQVLRLNCLEVGTREGGREGRRARQARAPSANCKRAPERERRLTRRTPLKISRALGLPAPPARSILMVAPFPAS